MPVTFPGTRLTLVVDIFIGGAWVDISTYAFYKNTPNAIRIKRGLGPDEVSHDSSPDSCQITLDNTDRRFSTLNINGPYFGLLKPNTPLRVRWNAGNGLVIRFEGKVPSWEPVIPVGDARQLRIEAVDVRGQMTAGAGVQVEASPLFTSTVGADPLQVYVPLEDGANTVLPQVVVGDARLQANGVIDWASDSDLPGSKPLPLLTTSSQLTMTIPRSARFDDHWQIDYFLKLNAAPLADTVYQRVYTDGMTNVRWDFVMGTGATGWALKSYDSTGANIVFAGFFGLSGLYLGSWTHHRLMITRLNATQCTYTYTIFPITGNGIFTTGTITDQPGRPAQAIVPAAAGLDGVGFGQWAVYNAYNYSTIDGAKRAYNDERPFTRFARLMTESGYRYGQRNGSYNDGQRMGYQRNTDLIGAIRETLLANEGFLVSQPGIASGDEGGLLQFIDRTSLENRVVEMTLDYSTGVIKDLVVADDQVGIVNDFTATRTGGASAVVQQRYGLRNVNDPNTDPLGVGRYKAGNTFNLSRDENVIDHAGWAVNIGTASPRVPSCKLWFERPGMSSLLTTWESFTCFKRFKITNPPTDFGPDPIDQIMIGYIEEITQFNIRVEIFGRPAAPYDIAILDTSGGAASDQRLDLRDSRLVGNHTSSETSLLVYSNGGTSKVPVKWAHDDGNWTARIGGEDMTVTAVADAAPSFIGAGVAQTSNNAAITNLTINAGAARKDLLLVAVYCRSTAATVAVSTAGYTLLSDPTFTNLRLYGKIHNGAETNPAVSVTGGAAGDDVIAQTGVFRNVSLRVLAFGSMDNTAAALNIANPALKAGRQNAAFILVGGKQDDATSVAAIGGGFAEIGEQSATAGNDALLVWDQLLASGVGTAIGSTSFVVTGGTNQPSRSIAVALECNVQTLTVTRGANNAGTGVTHVDGEEIHVKNPLILGVA